MLEDFDASRLEELAESLLADVSTEFENDATKSGNRIAQIEGQSKSVFRPVVGTQTENLESSENTNGSLNTPKHQPMSRTIKQEIIDCIPSDDELYVSTTAPIAPAIHMQSMQLPFDHTPFNHSSNEHIFDNNNNTTNKNNNNTITTNTNHICNTNKSMILCQSASDNSTDADTLYETTFDDEGHLITVILPDEDISNFEEVIEEMNHNDEEDDNMSHVSTLSANFDASPGGYSLTSGEDPTASDHDSAYDSVVNSPPGKMSSAWSTTSSINCIDDDYRYYDYWPQDSFSVLFPSLA